MTTIIPALVQAPTQLTRPFNLANGEKPQILRMELDFSAGGTITANVDLGPYLQKAQISSIQSMMVDNGSNDATVTVTFDGSLQVVTNPPNSNTTVNVSTTDPARCTVVCSGGTGKCSIFFYNFMQAPIVSSSVSVSAPFTFNSQGELLVSDPTLDGTVSGGEVQVHDADVLAALTAGITANVTDRGGTPTSRSTTTVATTSTQLMAANSARQYLLIGAPQSQGIWINPIGGTASVAGTDCIFIPSGGFYEAGALGSYVWRSAITYYSAAAGLALPAFEA